MTAPNTCLPVPVWESVLAWTFSQNGSCVFHTGNKDAWGYGERGSGEGTDTFQGSQALGQGLLAAFPQPSLWEGSLQNQHGQRQRSWYSHLQHLPCWFQHGLTTAPGHRG